jgi:hypothetical protein
MKKHSSQFDEKISKITRNEACGLPKEAGMRKGKIAVGKGRNGASALSPDVKKEIQTKWNEVVLPVTKCATYDELRQQLQSLQ